MLLLLLPSATVIRLALRCTPTAGTTDLHWLAGLITSLDAICEFLLRAEIVEQVTGRQRVLSPEDVERAVDGRAAEVGSPVVRLLDGSVVLDLAARPADGVLPVQVLASVAALFVTGPSGAAWPDHVRSAWFSPRTDADAARAAHERLVTSSHVEVVDDLGARPRRRRGKHGRRSRARDDLAGGVRVAPPLDV